MKNPKLRFNVDAEKSDYFYVKKNDAGGYTVTFTDGTRYPLSIRGLTRHQLYALISIAQRAIMDEQQEHVDAMYSEEEQVLSDLHKVANDA